MYIKEITLNGFKSYGQSRTLENMDKHFNAITGLNGSGKSNILDAICFVLGQNSPSQFRVNNMQELVYKKGAGGISFASVEIVFDNTDKNHKPSSYADCNIIRVERRIVLGPQGKSKFTINGANVTQAQVMDFFRSVQLNIQNPHFLIMQGRITKVLNMKPEDIWKMVEEAAGTMVYITKREATKKMIVNKEKQMFEVKETEKELIKPKIDRLQIERQNIIELQRLTRDYDAETRLLHAVDAYEKKIEAAEVKQEREELKALEQNTKIGLEALTAQLAESKERIKELEAEGEGEHGNSLNRLEEEYDKCRKILVNKEADIRSNTSLISEEDKRIEGQLADIEKEKTKITDQSRILAQLQKEIVAAEAKKLELAVQLDRAHQALAVVITGVGGAGNEDLSWKNQCKAAEEERDMLERQINKNTAILTNFRKDFHEAQKQSQLNSANKNILREIEEMQRRVDEIQADEPAFSEVEESRMTELEDRKRQLLNRRYAFDQEKRVAESHVPNLELDYQNPHPNFDRQKVYGAVAKFLNVKEPGRFLASIDSVAGGKKFNFVVEDDETSKALLNHGNIRRRVTILPMNRIRPPRLVTKADMTRIEQKVGHGKAWMAMDLVTYEPRMKVVIEYTLGNFVICADLKTANDIAFDPGLRFHCVTLDGDNVNPDGIVTGGDRCRVENLVLTHVHKLRGLAAEFEELVQQTTAIEAELMDLLAKKTRRQDWMKTLKEQQNKLDVLQAKCDTNAALRSALDADRLKGDIEKMEMEMGKDKTKMTELTEKIKDLKRKLASENSAEVEKMEATKNEKKCQDAVRAHDAVFERIRSREMDCQSAISGAQDAIKAANDEIALMQATKRDLQVEIERKQKEIEPYKRTTEVAQQKLEGLRQKIFTKNEGLRNAKAAERTIDKSISKGNAELKRIQECMVKKKETLKQIQDYLNRLFEEHAWLGDEYEKLGTEESTYKVDGLDLNAVQERVNTVKKKREELKRSTGSEVNADYDHLVKRHEELGRRTDLIKADKDKMEGNIIDLDNKKQQLIERAVSVVNEHFGKIFGTLLNGAHCKLERERDENGELSEALRIRVGFGKKGETKVLWKESLSELSGGQRSLVALSLVLAMLRMNPAPIYVLDEIDAALDLNHTQNVGKMIRKYFSQSQFIIVSLKEGMFTNANCIYRITFPGGLSAVTRTQKDKSNQNEEMDVSDEE